MYLYSLISTAQEQFCSGLENTARPTGLFTALPGDDAA
jgi:hypothetical protein